MNEIIQRLRAGLIVSCQAPEGTPLHGSHIMAAMAKAAEIGGAVGIRANGPNDIRAVRAAVPLPIIGIYKVVMDGYDTYITPTLDAAQEVADAGADIIAADLTLRPHPRNLTAAEKLAQIKTLGLPVMADISTFEEGVAAAEAGADIVATTMSGYTPYSPQIEGPDFELIRRLAATISVPIIAEGKIWTPEEARRAIDEGAHAVVVGTAITRPHVVTERFAKALSKAG